MNTPDYIDPAVGIPLAAILYLAWWLTERHHAHKTGAGAAGAACGERARTRPDRPAGGDDA
ncbi:hypothetical protein KZC56_17550 [Microbacterium sp. SSW1-47]|uniref:hypothetical protein n=1 Tax=Microbacterium sufflavum TaxID=2851649 RepID=UPI001FFD07EA|nr:hypothetical protein [Microbacterium sufflavum]MCK2028106.1 hypothetical protein [Microbacterium sufflavum]